MRRNLLNAFWGLPGRTGTLGVLVGLVAAGCAADASSAGEERRSAPAGKADTTTRTSDNTRAEPGAEYFQRRNIDNLKEVGAFQSQTARSMAERVDGILDAQPADDWIDLEELERMDQPPYAGSLFPEEKQALDRLWELMKAPERQIEVDTGSFTTRDDIEEVLPEPVELPDRVAIEELPVHLVNSRSVERLQLQFDDDNDPSTVSITDLEQALEEPGRYTEREIDHFEQTREYISKVRAQIPSGVATLVVPGLGERTEQVDSLGPAELSLVRRTYMEEQAQEYPSEDDWRFEMTLRHEVELKPGLPEGAEVIAVYSRSEQVRRDGERIRWDEEGLALEVWQEGRMQAQAWVTLPGVPEPVELDSYVGYRFEDEDGTGIPRSERRTIQPTHGSGVTTLAYSGAVPRNLGGESASYRLPGEQGAMHQWGRYEFTLEGDVELAIEIYEGGTMPIVWMELNGQRIRATYRNGYRAQRAWTAGATAHEHYTGAVPILSYVAQRPFGTFRGEYAEGYAEGVKLEGLDRVER